ncbi:hypothetical protein [Hellea balneolensis]|uniref:hypothetical protein n=1 Tax=Hellea balneolensis TaxID=287478 RepID=UPI00040874D6|nr:hypothetical protein [Hellea balneolensis]
MIWIFLTIITLIVLLWLTAPLLRGGHSSKIYMSILFAAFLASSLGTYALIGRSDLLKDGALKPYEAPRGPSAEQVQAAQQMSPEERTEMITAMVEGLAMRLEEEPNDPQGWQRLLRARKVLGQTEKLQADIARMKLVFKDRPDVIEAIMQSAQ